MKEFDVDDGSNVDGGLFWLEIPSSDDVGVNICDGMSTFNLSWYR